MSSKPESFEMLIPHISEVENSVDLATIAKKIVQQENSLRKLSERAAIRAVEIGCLLHAARKRCKHGLWKITSKKSVGSRKRPPITTSVYGKGDSRRRK